MPGKVDWKGKSRKGKQGMKTLLSELRKEDWGKAALNNLRKTKKMPFGERGKGGVAARRGRSKGDEKWGFKEGKTVNASDWRKLFIKSNYHGREEIGCGGEGTKCFIRPLSFRLFRDEKENLGSSKRVKLYYQT